MEIAQHQRNYIEAMKDNSYYGVFAEAGTGKTATALTYLVEEFSSENLKNCLIIAPASLLPNWIESINKMTMFGHSEDVISMLKERISLTSYTSIWDRGDKKNQGIPKKEYNIQWDCVICDESHRLGDPSSLQTRAILKLKAKRRYILTGTPDCGVYTKLYGQIKFLDPLIWKNFKEFKANAVRTYDFFKKPLEYDISYCEALKRVYGHAVRLIDCFDMPTCNEITHYLDIEDTKTYKAFLKGDTLNYNIPIYNIGVLKLKTLQLVSGHIICENELGDKYVVNRPTSKLSLLFDIIDGSSDKIVIIAKYRASVRLLSDYLLRKNIKHHIFDGDTTDNTPSKFQQDDSKVIIVQYQKAIGIDLFASHTMIFYEPTFSALELEQAKARIFRKGQTQNCIYHYFSTRTTLEDKIWDKIRSGLDVSKQMLEEWIKELK